MFSKKYKTIPVFFLAIAVCTGSWAQNTDSLKQVVAGNTAYPEKIKAYTALCDIAILKNFDDCISYADAATALALANKDSVPAAHFLSMSGNGDYFKGNYDKASEKYFSAVPILERNNGAAELAGLYNNLGRLFRKTKDLDRSLAMYDEAMRIYKRLNDKNGLATILNESGVVFEYKEDYKEAINRYQQSLDIREEMNDLLGESYSLNFIGGVYTLTKDYTKAEDYLQRSLTLREKIKDTFAIALNYSDLGTMYAQKGDIDKAISSFEQSNKIAAQLQYRELMSANYKEMSGLYQQKGDFKTSLELFKKHTLLNDSIFNAQKAKQIEELNTQYETGKKDSKINEQRLLISKRNYIIIFIAGLLLAGIILGYLFYNRYKLKQQTKLQLEILKQQDLSTKAVIAAEENERKRIAAELHDGVGQMMSAAKMNLSSFENEIPFTSNEQRLAYEKAMSLVDESCKEVRSVSHQMMPNALLKSGLASAIKEFLDKIDSRVIKINLHTEGLNERLESNTETVLYRVIQECVNNVIKHSGASLLDISLIKDADGIAVTVEDNGKGFNSSEKGKFEGIGLKNILTRVQFLKGSVEFDSAPGKGTLVAIYVPG